MSATPHGSGTLWPLVAAPAIWAAHFLASYVTAAVWCAKIAGPSGSLSSARTAIVAYTVVALAMLALVGWRGYREHAPPRPDAPHEGDSALSRRRFLGFATLLLSSLSAVAIAFAAAAVLAIGDCR